MYFCSFGLGSFFFFFLKIRRKTRKNKHCVNQHCLHQTCNLAWRKLQKVVNSLCPKLRSRPGKEKSTCKILLISFLWLSIAKFGKNHWMNITVKTRPTNCYSTPHWRIRMRKKGGKKKRSKQTPIMPFSSPFPTHRPTGTWSHRKLHRNTLLPLPFYSNSEQTSRSWRVI